MSLLQFGTDGIRTPVGSFPLTCQDLPQLGKAIAWWIIEKYGRNAQVLLAHDTRISCPWIKAGLKSGLLLHPLSLHDAGVLPSPAVCQLMRYYHAIPFDCGIIISASHNHYSDNGIKLIDNRYLKISAEDELKICKNFSQSLKPHYYELATEHLWTQASEFYIQTIQQFFDTNFLINKKVVLDCAHGAASTIAPSLFKYFGATVTTINAQPNGYNINKKCGSLHIEALQQAVLEQHADIGFAFDGDADRVIAVNRYGQVKNGDDLLALLLDHPHYTNSNVVVGTIMTNHALEVHLQKRGITLLRTNVGDKYVSQQMTHSQALLGGEPSGHIIASDYLSSGDGIFTALRVVQALNVSHNWDMETFIKYPQCIINIPIKERKDLSQEPYSHYIKQGEQALTQGRMIIRYSGTEPLLRIMIEDIDFDHAQSVGNKIAAQLQQLL